jgi:hypothetical protein
VHKFSTNLGTPENSRDQKGDIKEVLHWGPTFIRCHRTKCSRRAFVHLCPVYFKSRLNIILLCTYWFSKCFLTFTFSELNLVYITHRLVRAASSHHPTISNYSTYWCLVKRQICESSCYATLPVSCYFISPWSNHYNHIYPQYSQSIFFLMVGKQVPHLTEQSAQFNFVFFNHSTFVQRPKDEILWTGG